MLWTISPLFWRFCYVLYFRHYDRGSLRVQVLLGAACTMVWQAAEAGFVWKRPYAQCRKCVIFWAGTTPSYSNEIVTMDMACKTCLSTRLNKHRHKDLGESGITRNKSIQDLHPVYSIPWRPTIGLFLSLLFSLSPSATTILVGSPKTIIVSWALKPADSG